MRGQNFRRCVYYLIYYFLFFENKTAMTFSQFNLYNLPPEIKPTKYIQVM